jgi:Recombinase/Recombinase zinc beta ribbon domain
MTNDLRWSWILISKCRRPFVGSFFATFPRVGSALGTAKAFRKEKILFPHRTAVRGPRDQVPVIWKDLKVDTVLRVLHNPRYAGIYCYGKTRQYRTPQGRSVCQKRPADEWCAWIPDAHPGYISQQTYEENRQRLADNAQAIGADRRSPPREGPALLQGLVVCGRCGRKMGVHYHWRVDELVPGYVCVRKEELSCQVVHGTTVDEAVGELLVELMTPMTLEVSLSVQQELAQRFEQAERLRRQQVDRALRRSPELSHLCSPELSHSRIIAGVGDPPRSSTAGRFRLEIIPAEGGLLGGARARDLAPGRTRRNHPRRRRALGRGAGQGSGTWPVSVEIIPAEGGLLGGVVVSTYSPRIW